MVCALVKMNSTDLLYRFAEVAVEVIRRTSVWLEFASDDCPSLGLEWSHDLLQRLGRAECSWGCKSSSLGHLKLDKDYFNTVA